MLLDLKFSCLLWIHRSSWSTKEQMPPSWSCTSLLIRRFLGQFEVLPINSIMDQDQSCYLLCHSNLKPNKQRLVSFHSFPCTSAQLCSKIIIISLSTSQKSAFKADRKKSPHGLLCLIIKNQAVNPRRKTICYLKKKKRHNKNQAHIKNRTKQWNKTGRKQMNELNMLEFVCHCWSGV